MSMRGQRFFFSLGITWGALFLPGKYKNRTNFLGGSAPNPPWNFEDIFFTWDRNDIWSGYFFRYRPPPLAEKAKTQSSLPWCKKSKALNPKKVQVLVFLWILLWIHILRISPYFFFLLELEKTSKFSRGLRPRTPIFFLSEPTKSLPGHYLGKLHPQVTR